MGEGKYLTKLVGKREETEGVKTFSFSPQEEYNYIAGQYTFYEFDFGGEHYRKHLTISNSPTRENIQLTTFVSDSDFKQALDSLPEGSDVEVSEPMGDFTLESRRSDRIAYLVGGIGITPVRSMLQYVADSEEMSLDIFLFYSNKNEERILFREELEELSRKIGNVNIIHTLTGLSEEEQKEWDGETGHIDQEMINKYLGREKTFFYIVGPPAFNKAMEELLMEEMEIEKEMVIKEDFPGY